MRPINWRYQLQQYGTAFVMAAEVFAVLGLYLFARRGYFNLYIMNKVLAGVSLVLLGVVLIIGPLCTFSPRCQRYLQYRKELGILALLAGLAHGIISIWPLSARFPLASLIDHWPTTLAGILGLVLLTYLGAISNLWALQRLGTGRWWTWQRWGARISFLLVMFHLVVMKWPGWMRWFREGGTPDLERPYLPPGSLVVAVIGAVVLLVRLIIHTRQRKPKSPVPSSTLPTPTIDSRGTNV